jgi:D-alanine-D-alanine ligase
VLHGPRGEDGTVAALCELAGVPYVGSGVGAGAVAMDKWVTKLVGNEVGIATARGRLVTSPNTSALPWDGPVVVKPVTAGSSFGVSLVEDPRQLGPAVDAALAYGPRALVEEVVAGREIDIAVLGLVTGERVVSPPLEIVSDGPFDHATKYDGTAEFLLPAELEDGEHKDLVDAALVLYDALGCAGVARLDFFLTKDRGWLLNEVNTMPGLTEHSQVPRMFAADGLPYPALLDLLVRDALCSWHALSS